MTNVLNTEFFPRKKVHLGAGWVHVGLLVLVGILVVAGAVSSDRFFTSSNALNVLRAAAVPLTVALGQTIVVLTAAIDLSVGSVISLAGTLLAVLVRGQDGALPWAIPIVLVVCTSVGALNGIVVTLLRVHPIIATLGMSAIAQGAALLIAPRPITGPIMLEDLAFGDLLGLPAGTAIALILGVAALIFLKVTRSGRRIYAVGGSDHSASLMGINVNAIKILAFCFSSFCAGLAGIYMVGLLGSGSPIMGQGYELSSITPVVLGGTLLSGGVGGVGGTLLAVLFVVILNNLLNFMQVSTFYQWVIQGAIILFAVSTFSNRGAKS